MMYILWGTPMAHTKHHRHRCSSQIHNYTHSLDWSPYQPNIAHAYYFLQAS